MSRPRLMRAKAPAMATYRSMALWPGPPAIRNSGGRPLRAVERGDERHAQRNRRSGGRRAVQRNLQRGTARRHAVETQRVLKPAVLHGEPRRAGSGGRFGQQQHDNRDDEAHRLLR